MHQILRDCRELTQQQVDLSRITPSQLTDEQHEEITVLNVSSCFLIFKNL